MPGPLKSPKQDDWCEILEDRCPSCHKNNDIKALKRYVPCEAKNTLFIFSITLSNHVDIFLAYGYLNVFPIPWIIHVICRLKYREPA